ncbi:MAG: hypothetical protein OXT64_02925 [Gammaproteobacteria bacterium]|nr:hypothetical protein [Gammaproteobacteria bacterium]
MKSSARGNPSQENALDPMMSTHPYRYSMVLDNVPAHPYQVENLLRTLETLGAVPREAVVVQCTDRVPESVKSGLAENGYTVVVIEPYLDRKYCNKIVQLDHFASREEDGCQGLFLFDSDTVVIAPLDVPDPGRVWGKIVDFCNPPLSTLEKLFSAAGVALPPIVRCDWDVGDTIDSNFNGGMLYIPMQAVAKLRAAWRRWAEFLFLHAELFPRPSEHDHVDQISFAMALASEGFSYGHLPANWNYPCHEERPVPLSFEPDEGIRVLHYHQCLDAFGMIAPVVSGDAACEAAVDRANAVILEPGSSIFFDYYKRGLATRAVADIKPFPMSFHRALLAGKRRRLILHGGTPKTGTSALQWCLDANRSVLAERGFWYPPPSNRREPKHQELIGALMAADQSRFEGYVESSLSEMPSDTHTVILSTEGIFNHWWDLSPAAKGMLRGLADEFDFELCVWFREPESFAAALYAQYLRNPGTDDSPDVYGRDIDFSEAMRDPWFRRHLDYLGFYYEAQALFGTERVRAFLFGSDTVSSFMEQYGTGALARSDLPRNESMREAGIRIMRIANRFQLSPAEHDRVEDLVFEIDGMIGDRGGHYELNRADLEAVRTCAARGWETLQSAVPGLRTS